MKKFRTFLAAIMLVLATLVAGGVTSVTPAHAIISCQTTGTGGHYIGTFCTGAGTFHKTVARCQYRYLGIYHTYTVYGNRVPDNEWSWAYCGYHTHDLTGAPYFYITGGTDLRGWYDKVIDSYVTYG